LNGRKVTGNKMRRKKNETKHDRKEKTMLERNKRSGKENLFT